MSTLTFSKQTFRGSPLNGSSPLPSLYDVSAGQSGLTPGDLPEGDPLHVGYGSVRSIYPYTQQNRYNRELMDVEVETAVLENGHIRATFLPGWGGRLWKLWDKDAGRDLVYANDVLRPSNLGLRNAWFSGGVEWNCGIIGHHPFTCSQMFTAAYENDGAPVLRFYQWERIRNITFQVDLCLPEDSRFLLARVRIHNPNPDTVPMYWWSNTAVPEREGGRVAVPAREAYEQDEKLVNRRLAPILGDGTDLSYPMRTYEQKDYFYILPSGARMYEGYIDSDGMGLIQTSTSRLKGRKLFVWGQKPASKNWQRFLTENAGPYVEVQAGLGRSQYGCLPMQPGGVWEFAEAYGPIAIIPEMQKAGYPAFLSVVEAELEKTLPARQLEDWLVATSGGMGRRYVPARAYGGGDAALENALRLKTGQSPLNQGLDFGETEPDQADFAHLLAWGYMPFRDRDYVPSAFVAGPYWRKLLETAANGPDRDNWLTWYHLGLVLLDEDRGDNMERPPASAIGALKRAADLCTNGSVLYVLADALARCGETAETAACAVKSCRLFGGDLSVAKDCLRLLTSIQAHDQALALYDDLPETVKTDGRVEFWRATALVHLGRCDEALEIIQRPGFVIADQREAEQSINALWAEIKRRTGKADLELPERLNFATRELGE